MPLPDIYVLRHGETVWNVEGRLQGGLDSPLTERGEAQARQQGRILRAAGLRANRHLFLSSPQGRAMRTAEIALAPIGARARPEPALAEIDLGPHCGALREDLRMNRPEIFEGPTPLSWYFRLRGAETRAALEARCHSLLAHLDPRGPAVVLFTHGITSRFLRGAALGLEGDAVLELPGGQGIVYRIRGGRMERLESEEDARAVPGGAASGANAGAANGLLHGGRPRATSARVG